MGQHPDSQTQPLPHLSSDTQGLLPRAFLCASRLGSGYLFLAVSLSLPYSGFLGFLGFPARHDVLATSESASFAWCSQDQSEVWDSRM